MRFSKAEPYSLDDKNYQLWVVQTPEGYEAEAIKDNLETIRTPVKVYPSANEALEGARAVAQADAGRCLQVR